MSVTLSRPYQACSIHTIEGDCEDRLTGFVDAQMGSLLWLKALHIIFVVTWFAGIFYIPRLFIYHSQAKDPAVRQLFNLMENRLYKVIMMPSMVLTLILGGTLLALHWASVHQSSWIWLKLTLVITLVGYHHYCGALIRRLASLAATDPQPHTDKFLRVFNEIPALLLIIIVLLAVIRPF